MDGKRDFKFGFGQKAFTSHHCRVSACYTTDSKDFFKPDELDAVIWSLSSKDKSIPKNR